MYKWILTILLILMTMVGMRVDSVRKIDECFERAPANLKKYLGLRIRNAPKTLKGTNVRLKFQFKCWEGGDVGMSLVEMRHMERVKAYVRYSNVQMMDTPKIMGFLKNASF